MYDIIIYICRESTINTSVFKEPTTNPISLYRTPDREG